jgi:hypothetical protein
MSRDMKASLNSLRDAFRDGYREGVERLESIVNQARYKLPPIEIPEPQLDEPPDPLVSSDMDLADAISILKDRKDYSA